MHLSSRIPYISFVVPLGLAFFTLKAISYVVDVYKSKVLPEVHFGYYALFISFFPQITAGPIERASHFLPQLRKKITFSYEDAREGAFLIAFGFFKKMVIADRLALIVSSVYDHPHDYQGLQFMIATFLFAIQIYCDFSGYSDIAIGSAQVLGIKTTPNFNKPYAAQSITEFWERWHISFSSWLRDYVYIPLGGSRVSKLRLSFNIVVTFIVSGLWHGANWTFVVWGLLYSLYLIIPLYIGRFIPKFHRYINIVITFLLVSFAWIFFRAHTVADAWYIITHLFRGTKYPTFLLLQGKLSQLLLFTKPSGYIVKDNDLLFMVYMLAIFLCIQLLLGKKNTIRNMPLIVRWLVYYILIITVTAVFFIYSSDSRQFIYATF